MKHCERATGTDANSSKEGIPHTKPSISAEKLHRASKGNGTQQSQQLNRNENKNKIKTNNHIILHTLEEEQ